MAITSKDQFGNTVTVGPDGSQQSIAAGPTGAAGGDLSGTYPDPFVTGFNSIPIKGDAPNLGDLYIYTSKGVAGTGLFPVSIIDLLGLGTPGDMLYLDADGDLAVLAAGNTGQVMTMDSTGVPSWQ